MYVNLLSDTVTMPTEAMKSVMMNAELGDDVFEQDPSVNALQEYGAGLFGMEGGLFCPSGTMTNQVAIQLHTGRTDAVICEEGSHIYQYETGGYAYNAGVAITPIRGTNGKITADQIDRHTHPQNDWYPRSSLVVIENTCNKGGGSYYTLSEIEPIASYCREHNLALHLDGARIFNALAATREDPLAWGRHFDTISICLSKGLGAPVGSLLLGSKKHMQEARRLRKVMGGGMRQAGILAAGGLYALQHHRDRLVEDHVHAAKLADVLSGLPGVRAIRPVATNIVIVEVDDPANEVVQRLAKKGIAAAAMANDLVRFVTHLDVTSEMIDYCCDVLPAVFNRA
ncbi:MAG: threonine aldolase [Saprospiraceae bacterium]|nr:threonine aldolase [Saprospiraceae bacterium]